MKIDFVRLDHIQICIPKDEETKAKQFYCEILGLEEIEKPDPLKANGGFWLKFADIQVHIGTEIIEGKSKRHPAFEVINLMKVKSYLIEKGVKIKEDTAIPNVDRFSLFDPFDNRIEFLEYKK